LPDISFQNFSFRYDNLKEATLQAINLTIAAGEKVLIAGASGSGKSTLAHCINGLIPFTYPGAIGGVLEIGGIRPYERSIDEISQWVGTILQDQDGQFVGLTVGEDVAFAAENRGVDQDTMRVQVTEALNEVGMVEYIDETPHNLSGGQKQKVAIAGILTTNAPILLFDEPLANLDPASGKRAMATIRNIHEQTGKTVIVIEHRIEDVLEHGFDRIVVIDAGRIVADGPPDEILATDVLSRHGLREPLYIEALKRAGVRLTPSDRISAIAHVAKFKAQVGAAYPRPEPPPPPAAAAPLLRVSGVSYRYFEDGPDILHDISFTIQQGEMLAILGNNGAGKSTLLKVLTGIARHQKGVIEYQGESIARWSIRKRATIIGYVMQNPNQMITKPLLFDEVAFGLRNRGCAAELVDRRVEETLRICGLYPYRKWPVDSLSYGQKKRVTIAAILALQPRLIVLDEPTAGQDHRTYQEFMGFLERIKQTGISVVLITHDMQLALEYADRALVLSGGTIIAADSVFRILSDPAITRRANLKETSLSQLAYWCEIDDAGGLMASFIRQAKHPSLFSMEGKR
jgi:energy-coupling factor transport system ATP-binding protein